MANFNNGDLVIGTRSTHGVATDKVLCVVRRTPRYSYTMKVEIVGGKRYYSGLWYNVNKNEFDLCTVDEYLAKYPNAVIDYGKFTRNMPEGGAVFHMDMSKSYAIAADERENLIDEVCKLFANYKLTYKKEAVTRIIDKWVQEKGWIIELFKKHPNYNGKYQITFDEDYQRKFDVYAVRHFANWIESNRSAVLKRNVVKITAFTYNEAAKNLQKVKDLLDYMGDIENDLGYKGVSVNGKSIKDIREDKEYWRNIIDKYLKSDGVVIYGGNAYSSEAYSIYENLRWLYGVLESLNSPNITESQANNINAHFDVKVAAGTKTSRVINRIMVYTGLADLPDYNKEFAKYADAVNPVAIKRHTILSVHPIDYLTMSNGNSWSSCHSVVNGGGYCSGTISYMLDRSSFVYYTVDKAYSGNELEKQPKITRCMFHMGYEKLVQGRMYPQGNDGDSGVYLEVRNIVRRVLAAALDVADDWTIKKGTAACNNEIETHGTHYPDYEYNGACNVSRIKRKDGYVSHNKIIIGSRPLCINCGREHGRTSNRLKCGSCY